MNRKEELTDEFQVVDNDGRKQTLYVYTTFTEFRPIAGDPSLAAGSKRLQSENGGHVNANPDGTFVELETGRVLRKVASR